jgi:hypothetical protein
MANKREKDRIYYEVTKERPLGTFHLLLVGGASGSVLSFLIVTLVGAYAGMDLDGLVLFFLMANFIGFLVGASVVWLSLKYLEPRIPDSFLIGRKAIPAPPQVESVTEVEGPVLEDSEAKGKSVDFVFPELTPDKQ